ncbi:T9SS type A sorting domain-containing protein [Aestuariivivens marinum]|uniref:T9SS type A sorting domain-containing protein n=1 Tax=Aestuariivivens marinum TaxID=2913555 RepID=UPI001F5A77AE|nr:T9SS type A sorting domain-containing protein [Aestuariivivens marinum]
MKTISFLLILVPTLLFSQIQIGSDINGEADGDWFGQSVSLSSDGSIVAIEASHNNENGVNSGHVRVYRNDNDVWTQIGSDIDGEAEYDWFGQSVSLSSDGSIVAIGAYGNDNNGSGSGQVCIYKNDNDVWTKIGSDINGEAAGDVSGWSVNLSSDGSIIAIGATGAPPGFDSGTASGYVRIYKNDNNVWTKIGSDINGEIASGDKSGYSVSLSSDGGIIAIGTVGNINGTESGHVKVFDLSAVLSSDGFVLQRLNVFPNPSSNIINVQLKDNIDLKRINIYNNLAQLLFSTREKEISTNNLSPGYYFVEVETDQGRAAKMFVVK